MSGIVTHDRPGFLVTSYWNGGAYEFRHKASGLSVYFQGDDATQFRDELDAYGEHWPDYDAALAQLWSDYECVAA